jgi:hypothetical protein
MREPTQPPPTRRGKVSITEWVDSAPRNQVQKISLNHDKDQYELIN